RYRVETMLYRPEDILRIVVSRQHVSVGHARHWNVLVALAPAVARPGGLQDAGAQLIFEIAPQNSIFNQHCLLRGLALIVHIQRTTPGGDGSVIDHGAKLGSHALSDAAAEGGNPFAVEIRLEPVPDGLVQQDARPAWSQHHFHFTGRRLAGRELNDGLPRRLAAKILRRMLAAEEFQTHPTPAPTRPRLQIAFLFGDTKDSQPYQRPEIGHRAALRTRNQHVANLVPKGDANLF